MNNEPKPYEKGQQMECSKCGTRWWDGTAGMRCPSCDPRFDKMKDKLTSMLSSKAEERDRAMLECDLLGKLLTHLQSL